MEVILGGAFVIFALWMLFEFPEILIPIIIIFVLMKACTSTDVEVVVEEAIDEVVETVQNAEQPETAPEPSVLENSVEERCLDGITYLLIVENGQTFMAPKEDTFGYNIKCSE